MKLKWKEHKGHTEHRPVYWTSEAGMIMHCITETKNRYETSIASRYDTKGMSPPFPTFEKAVDYLENWLLEAVRKDAKLLGFKLVPRD